MKTASWFTPLPPGHVQVGISRGVPRRTPGGYRMYRKLAPGPWFASCATPAEYDQRYQTEILGPLDPRVVAADLADLARGDVPVLLCFERPETGKWCHRALVGEWLHKHLGTEVPEVGYEHLSQAEHPLMHPSLRPPIVRAPAVDLSPYIGRSATIAGELYHVIAIAEDGRPIVRVGTQEFPTTLATLERHFTEPA